MYCWLAEYKNGSIVKQLCEDGTTISSDSIDREQVKTFCLMFGERCVVRMHIADGQKLVYRRRVEKTIGGPETACYLVGWRKSVGGEIVQSMTYVFEDGTIEVVGDFQEDHPWFYAPKLRDFELP